MRLQPHLTELSRETSLRSVLRMLSQTVDAHVEHVLEIHALEIALVFPSNWRR